jgi:Excreted virulence factor EspC, type VII ESX diderm
MTSSPVAPAIHSPLAMDGRTGSVDGFTVDPEQLRAHADNLEALRGRLDAVVAASSHIARDDQAYGLLCGWIAGILEGRHVRQDALIVAGDENLSLAAESIADAATQYEGADAGSAQGFSGIDQGMPR